MTNKVTTWVLILALLISQSYAYAFEPCESTGHASSEHNNDMDSMDHSLLEHDMSSHMQHDTQQQEFAMDCCDQQCSCLTGTCASVTLTHFMTATPIKLISEPSGFELFSIQETFLPSLRKPPIIG
jgi:hypothetical protein